MSKSGVSGSSVHRSGTFGPLLVNVILRPSQAPLKVPKVTEMLKSDVSSLKTARESSRDPVYSACHRCF